jgi:hypothetical protein
MVTQFVGFLGGWNHPGQFPPLLAATVAALSAVLASRKNGDYQRATGAVYRASFSTGGYRRLTPRFLPVSNKGHRSEEIRVEIDRPRVVPEPAERMVVGIDGAFVNHVELVCYDANLSASAEKF